MSQSLEALAYADEIRIGRCRIRRQLKARETTLSEALQHPHTQSMTLSKLLQALPSVGPLRAKRITRKAGISEDARVCELGELEREELVEVAGP